MTKIENKIFQGTKNRRFFLENLKQRFKTRKGKKKKKTLLIIYLAINYQEINKQENQIISIKLKTEKVYYNNIEGM